MKGLHFSPATEFQKGQCPVNHLPVGSVKIRTTKRDNKQKAWVKIAEPSKWILRVVKIWEDAYGLLSKDLMIHHIDGNTLNDDLRNLAAVSRAMHINIHRRDLMNGKMARKRIADDMPLFSEEGDNGK